MRKLDLLVPHWQETSAEMEPLLDSLQIQQGIDLSEVGVVIAYDGPDASELPIEEWDNRYDFEIDVVRPPKGGVSATRNAALDASESEYVCFCDADDMLDDACGLFIVFEQIEKTRFQVLITEFREQTKGPDDKMTFVPHPNNSTFVHGVVLNRKWLMDNDLRFSPPLVIHEDSYFVILCRETASPEKTIYCPYPWYLWKWRDASVCRHDPDYLLKTMPDMIKSSDALVDEFVRRLMPEKANAYCGMNVWSTYYALNKPEWVEKTNRHYRDEVERLFAAYFRKHRSKWDALSQQEKLMISNGVRQRSIMEGMLMEAVTIDQWLAGILEKYPA